MTHAVYDSAQSKLLHCTANTATFASASLPASSPASIHWTRVVSTATLRKPLPDARLARSALQEARGLSHRSYYRTAIHLDDDGYHHHKTHRTGANMSEL